MFRRLPNQLPQDANYPSNLRKLGLFINESHQLKQSDHPEDAYRFAVTTNNRYNEVREEAVNICLREELANRLSKLGVKRLWLPSLTNERPKVDDGPTMPIFATELKELKKAKRVVVVVGKLTEDLGIWDWKSTRGEPGLEAGTVVGFVKDMMARSFPSVGEVDETEKETTAFIMPNPGQLLYSYKHNRAMTLDSWSALPRPSALHMAPLIDEKMNRIEGSEAAEKHLTHVFEKIVANEAFVSKDAEVFLLGLNDGADQLVKMLEENWTTYSTKLKVAGVAFINPLPLYMHTSPLALVNADFLSFLAQRGRTWSLSRHPLNTALANTTTADKLAELKAGNLVDLTALNEEIHLTPAVSCGAAVEPGDMMPTISSAVLDWFEDVAAGGVGYANEPLEISEEILEELRLENCGDQDDGVWSSEELTTSPE